MEFCSTLCGILNWRGVRGRMLFIIHLCPVRLFATPWMAECQVSMSFTIYQRLLKLMSFELVMPSNHLILYYSLLLLPSIFPSQGSFPISRLFASGNQSVGASASVLPKNIQDWSPLGLTGLSSLLSKDIGGEWIHVCVYVWLSPFTVHLKLSQHCLLIGYTPVQI